MIYTVRTKGSRDVDHVLEIQAMNEYELSRIVHGMDLGNGNPDDFEIIGTEKAFPVFVCCRENGEPFEEVNDLESGLALIEKWESDDRREGVYTDNYYQVCQIDDDGQAIGLDG